MSPPLSLYKKDKSAFSLFRDSGNSVALLLSRSIVQISYNVLLSSTLFHALALSSPLLLYLIVSPSTYSVLFYPLQAFFILLYSSCWSCLLIVRIICSRSLNISLELSSSHFSITTSLLSINNIIYNSPITHFQLTASTLQLVLTHNIQALHTFKFLPPEMLSFAKLCQCSALVAFATFSSFTNAHSWVEQLTTISPNGTFIGAPGFARGNVLRSAPNFGDPLMVYLLPPDGRPASDGILKSDLMCKDSQTKQVQTDGSPRLQAAPGALVALRYQENGHVTLPQNQPGKPENRGNVFIYGTTQPSETDTFLGIHKQWNAAGTGGDKRGKLLATQPFDDSQCYQINGGEISVGRQAQFPHQANQLMGADLWCQNDIAIPSDAPAGKPYTLYWVWEWPTAPNVDPGLPKGKEETYTTCMDIDLETASQSNSKVAARAAPENGDKNGADTSIANMAVAKYMEELTQKSDPPSPQPATIPQSSQNSPEPAHSAATQAQSQKPEAPQLSQVQATAKPSIVTVTRTAKAKPSTVTVTESALPTEAKISTTVVTISPSASATTIVEGRGQSTDQASATPSRSNQSSSGTPLALPVVIPGATSSASPSTVPRCVSCKVNKRSRIFGSGGHRHRRL